MRDVLKQSIDCDGVAKVGGNLYDGEQKHYGVVGAEDSHEAEKDMVAFCSRKHIEMLGNIVSQTSSEAHM